MDISVADQSSSGLEVPYVLREEASWNKFMASQFDLWTHGVDETDNDKDSSIGQSNNDTEQKEVCDNINNDERC